MASSTIATEVTTNADGTFVVTGVGPGDVELEPLLPDGMTLVFSSVRRTIGDGGCVDWPLRAAFNGRVRGMVRAATGTALPWVALEVVPADDKQARTAESDSHTRASANRDGQFEFSAISPGTYWLGVNLRHGPSGGAPYPPTYFPGTTNRDDAVPIVIGQGTQHDAFNFVLNPPLAHWRIEVQIDPGGERQRSMYACFSQAGRAIGIHAKQNDQPIFLDVVEGEQYQVSAHADMSVGHVHAESAKFIPTIGQTDLRLKGTRTAGPHVSGSPCDLR